MSEEIFSRLRDWVEPAHPMIVKLREDLLALYSLIREQYQQEIDRTFDRVSRHIGFVVATTVPAVFEVDENGVLKNIAMGAAHLRGTLFDRALSETLNPLVGTQIAHRENESMPIAAGTYNIYLIWYQALKLKLHTDWLEPAHFRRERISELRGVGQRVAPIPPEVQEPAHWFDPGIAINFEEKLQIAVLDEVYPDLRLAERVAAPRQARRMQVRPEVVEPAHFRRFEPAQQPEITQEMLGEIAAVLKRYGYRL